MGESQGCRTAQVATAGFAGSLEDVSRPLAQALNCRAYGIRTRQDVRRPTGARALRPLVSPHFFLDDGQRKTVLRDEVDYLPPLGKLGDLLGGWFVESKLRRMFDHRHLVTKQIVESGEFPKVSQVP